MIRLTQAWQRDNRAATTVEFALAAPGLLVLVFGLMQVGMAFLANAGVRNAVEAGARKAVVYPRPTDTTITSTISANTFGLDSSRITGPTLTHGTANGVPYVDISMNYSYPFTLAFVPLSPINLSYTRRAYQN